MNSRAGAIESNQLFDGPSFVTDQVQENTQYREGEGEGEGEGVTKKGIHHSC